MLSSEEISKLEIGSKTNYIYAPMCLKGKCWVPVVINIERRSLIILDYATSFVSENVKRMHVVAYSVAMPYILRKLLNKTYMDVSAFKVSIVDNISQVNFVISEIVDCIHYNLFYMSCFVFFVFDARLKRLKILGCT